MGISRVAIDEISSSELGECWGISGIMSSGVGEFGGSGPGGFG